MATHCSPTVLIDVLRMDHEDLLRRYCAHIGVDYFPGIGFINDAALAAFRESTQP